MRDQAAAQRDLAADRRDRAGEYVRTQAGAEMRTDAHSPSALARGDAAKDRKHALQDRLAGARQRTDSGRDRDTAEADRGAGADERTWAELDRTTALADRGAGALERLRAEQDRTTALADRGAGAGERADAELDRTTAFADRGASAREREHSSLDDLTGTYHRDAGFLELEREIARARRAQEPLALAFVDVDGLKAVNDTRGHAAGDRTLLEVATAFRTTLRAHDLIVRYGGDEFVCAISGMTAAAAGRRLASINTDLRESPEGASVTIGLAQLRPDDTFADLVARADAALYAERERARRPAR